MTFRWLRRFLGIDPPLPPGPRPPGWQKTLADLSAENRSLSGEEIEWARQYELEQLRPWARFPRNGDRYEALEDLALSFQIYWKAPYTTGGDCIISKGTLVQVSVHSQDPEPLAVQAHPVRYQDFELRWVPKIDRESSKYAGYGLTLMVKDLNRQFRLVRADGN